MALAFMPRPIRELPWLMLGLVIAIVTFDVLVLYSAAGGKLTWALPQAMRFVVFFGLAIALSWVRMEWVKQAAFPAYVLTLLLLIFVEALGFVGGGAQRWLNLGFINLQPSELMKPVIVLATAHFYALLPAREIRGWSALWPAGVLIGIPAALILIQPDLGTATVVTLGGISVMFLAGVPLRIFLGGLAAMSVVGPIAFSFLHDYQQQRVLIFMDPEADPLGAGYHITQSKIAIGSGGIVGKGFGEGSQSHLNYLPEPHTDFVFATMAEEWGLLGGLLVLLVFGIVLRWGMSVARRAPDRFSQLLAGGMTATVFFYVAINLLMVMGLAPVVGIPLPFMSHGGSSMMTNMICIGTLMMVDRWTRKSGRTSTLS